MSADLKSLVKDPDAFMKALGAEMKMFARDPRYPWFDSFFRHITGDVASLYDGDVEVTVAALVRVWNEADVPGVPNLSAPEMLREVLARQAEIRVKVDAAPAAPAPTNAINGNGAAHLVDPEPPGATQPETATPDAKAEPLGNDEAGRDAAPGEGEQPPSDTKPEPSQSGEQRATGNDSGRARKGKAPPGGKRDHATDDDHLPLSDAEFDAEIGRLASLNPRQYERAREDAAELLGLRPRVLDKLVKIESDKLGASHISPLYPHWAVEPWEEPIDGGILLRALVERIQRHVALLPDQAVAIALWVMMTWVHEAAAVHSPLLLATSAEPESGKSTLLGVIGFLARRSLLSVSITGPVLFRSIARWSPTFAIDEADKSLVKNEDFREVINSGWTKGQKAVRCDPETGEPRPYSTFCPKAIAMKGRSLPDTTLSRAIVIHLRRKRPDETVDDFDHIDDEGFAQLRRQLQRWADDNGAALAKAAPEIPPGFHNRVRANWKLLFAIAELAGEDWKRQAWHAAGTIENVKATFAASIGIQLLQALRAMFGPGVDELRSSTIVANLIADDDGPWREYRHGKPITQKDLAGLLRDHGITPETVHPPGIPHGKGYKKSRLVDLFTLYLPASEADSGF